MEAEYAATEYMAVDCVVSTDQVEPESEDLRMAPFVDPTNSNVVDTAEMACSMNESLVDRPPTPKMRDVREVHVVPPFIDSKTVELVPAA